MVVLGVDYILEQDGTGAMVALDVGIERQVECDDLYAGIGLARVIKCVTGEYV